MAIGRPDGLDDIGNMEFGSKSAKQIFCNNKQCSRNRKTMCEHHSRHFKNHRRALGISAIEPIADSGLPRRPRRRGLDVRWPDRDHTGLVPSRPGRVNGK
jgi:hypothetical protein